MALAVFIFAAVAAWFRLPAAARDTFWAEDARIFSERVLDPGHLPWLVFTSYDGYVHALPQTVAFLLWHGFPIPVDMMAQAFTAAACAIAGAVAAGIYLLTQPWGLNVAGRLLLALTTVLVPGLNYEVLGNIANAHWLLLWFAPFLFLARPRRWWSAALVGVLAFVVLTSEVQAALFTPLLLWRIKDRFRWPMVVGALAGGLIQGIALLGGGRQTWGRSFPSVTSVLDGYAVQVPLLGISGSQQAASTIVAVSGWSAAFAALLPFILCAVWFAWGSRRRAVLAAGIFVSSLAIWAAGYALNQASVFDFTAAQDLAALTYIPLLRYAMVPLMLLYATVGLAAGRARLRPASLQAGVATALVVLCVALFAVNYRVNLPTVRSAGPTWAEGLEVAQQECDRFGADHRVEIPIAPVVYWTLRIDCHHIAD
jgi:hypothetical protein